MSAMQTKEQPSDPSRHDAGCSSPQTSAATELIEVGRALAGGDYSASKPGLCSQCWAPRSPHSSTARLPNAFCSQQCEEEFLRSALASLTLEDCIRIQGRLESLLAAAETAAVDALSGGV
jgi:hypothetical protein